MRLLAQAKYSILLGLLPSPGYSNPEFATPSLSYVALAQNSGSFAFFFVL